MGLLDWGGTDWVKDADSAHERYMGHLQDMEEEKATWTPEIVDILEENAERVHDASDSWFGGGGEEYWAGIAASEPDVLIRAGINPGQLEKIASHVAFVTAAGASAAAWTNALEQYSYSNVAQEVAKETAKDLSDIAKEKANPMKSVVPWIFAAVVGLWVFGKVKK
jgi:hypothetical protein